ncbi:MAG: hypothetical protein J6V45_05240, partial [Kiritimatiellae bacterium]|nr:hypothetical protein [Kiritimatiellia bacterium]
VMTPFTATVPGAGVVTVTESNLLDYPGLNFIVMRERRIRSAHGRPAFRKSWTVIAVGLR